MRRSDTETHLTRLETELFVGSGGLVSEAEVRREVRQALRDLAGSVRPESLPEMASRLAATRLATGPDGASRVPVAV